MVPGLTFALPKGRLFAPSLEILKEAGLGRDGLDDGDRRLVFPDPERGIEYLVARASDVPTYVEYGAADLGIVGKDILMEDRKDLYELLDLKFGFCRFVVAVPRERAGKGYAAGGRSLRVATKFPRVAEAFFRGKGLSAEIIKLQGAVELAPRVGLAEVIVDLVSTGRTLRENGLVEVEEIARASARLVANRVSFRMKSDCLAPVVEKIRRVVAAREEAGR